MWHFSPQDKQMHATMQLRMMPNKHWSTVIHITLHGKQCRLISAYGAMLL